MEEIICHACGRPNLPEAKKCWYCQEPLEKPDEKGAMEPALDATDSDPSDAGDMNAGQPLRHPVEANPIDGEIPEWLQRIRNLKKTDNIPEDDPDQWQQQRLFSPAAAPAKDSPTVGRPKRSGRPVPKPKRPAEPQPEPPPAVSLPLDLSHEKADKAVAQTDPEDSLSDELPEGFKPIHDSDNNRHQSNHRRINDHGK